MARQNRRDVFNPLEVSTVHCIQRVVRRAMLCGFDPVTNRCFDHRRQWIRQRLEFLAGQFGIDVLGYAILGNHLHVILRNRPDVVQTWSNEEVARRIWSLFPKRKDAEGQPLEPRPEELKALISDQKRLLEYRIRLSTVSWMMRMLAEKIARLANKEDDCTGRFWEGRFKCQPLLDEGALLACAAYVDLNPIRAGIAATPEGSEFTSIQDRIIAKSFACTANCGAAPTSGSRRDAWLAPVSLNDQHRPGPDPSCSGRRASDKGFLPMSADEYINLIDWTGRQRVDGTFGAIPETCAPILERFGLAGETWCDLVRGFGRLFRRVAGKLDSLAQSAKNQGLRSRQSAGGAALLEGIR